MSMWKCRWWVPLVVLTLAPAADAAQPAPPNILLIVIDTLRYSATGENTPFLASLASQGVVFSNAYSTHDFTPTSHFSLITGLRDGLSTDDDRVENGVPYQLRRIGYQTFATVANDLIGKAQMPTFRAFDDFKQTGDINAGTIAETIADTTDIDARLAIFGCHPTAHNRAMLYFSADRLLPIFLEQIQRARPPYFGFINLVDAHEPYVPDPQLYAPERELPRGFSGDVLQRPLGRELSNPDSIRNPGRRAYVKAKIAQAGAASLTTVDLSPEALAIYRKRYEASVREVDATLQEFFETLKREKRLDNTVVIITSDHGESFGEDDLVTHMFHDRGDFESTHHVPMLIVLPPGIRGSTAAVARRVSIANIPATIYDLAGLNWSAFRAAHPDYYASLLPLLSTAPPRYLASVAVPAPEKQDQTAANCERDKALRSLGYVH